MSASGSSQPAARLAETSPLIPCRVISHCVQFHSPSRPRKSWCERETINPISLISHHYLFTTHFFLRLQHFIRLNIPLSREPALATDPVKPAFPLRLGQIAAGTIGGTGRRGDNLPAVAELADIARTTMR